MRNLPFFKPSTNQHIVGQSIIQQPKNQLTYPWETCHSSTHQPVNLSSRNIPAIYASPIYQIIRNQLIINHSSFEYEFCLTILSFPWVSYAICWVQSLVVPHTYKFHTFSHNNIFLFLMLCLISRIWDQILCWMYFLVHFSQWGYFLSKYSQQSGCLTRILC